MLPSIRENPIPYSSKICLSKKKYQSSMLRQIINLLSQEKFSSEE